MAAQSHDWIRLQDFSGDIYECFSLNPDKFIIISHNYQTHIYDSRTNKFRLDECVSEYLKEMIGLRNLNGFNTQLALDRDNQDLYIINTCDARESILSLNVGSKDKCEFKMENPLGFGIEVAFCSPHMFFIDGHIHRIFMYHTIRSLCYADKTHCLLSKTLVEFMLNREGQSAIHIPSKNCILVIGGDGRYCCKDSLGVYSLVTGTWRAIEHITYKLKQFGAVLTSNERYIVLMGGSGNENDDIYVLDIKDDDDSKWKLKKSSIKCLQWGSCRAVRTGGVDSKDDVLVNGFVQDCFRQKEFNNLQLPPSYIIKIIVEFYSAEMIHWIYEDGDHCGIYLKDILSSLS